MLWDKLITTTFVICIYMEFIPQCLNLFSLTLDEQTFQKQSRFPPSSVSKWFNVGAETERSPVEPTQFNKFNIYNNHSKLTQIVELSVTVSSL